VSSNLPSKMPAGCSRPSNSFPSTTFSLASRIIRPHLATRIQILVCIYPVLVASYLLWRFVHRRNKGMPMLLVPIEHNVNSDRVCERG
jgi:hypothetical protein